jgi:LacI family transcriptional regulator
LRPTVKDVAKLSGVSTATVSNVLTNKKYVSDELKDKIKEAMDILGYEPNITARSLKVNKTFKIGVVVPDISNPFFSEIVKYIERTISKSEYQLVLYNSDDKTEKELEIFESLLLGTVDGLILIAPRMAEKLINRDYKIPVVILDRPAFHTESNITFIYADNYKGAELVADLFVKKGYQKFICITGPCDVPNANIRLEGFREALIAHGITAENIEEYRTEFDFDDCNAMMTELLQNYKPLDRKGVFVCSDIGAWGAIEAVKSKGLKIPKDIGIAGFDNIYFSRFIYPGLTTVQNPTKELGQSAAQVILNKLNGGADYFETTIVFNVELIERDTV